MTAKSDPQSLGQQEPPWPSDPPAYELVVQAPPGVVEAAESASTSSQISSHQRNPFSLPSISPRQRDLWSQAAETLEPRTLAKWEALPKALTVQEVLRSAKERARLQQSKVWKERWRSLMKSISTVKSLVDAGLQCDPVGYGALAWSIVSFGLDAAINNVTISDELAQGCDYIRAIVEEYAIYEARYLSIDSQGRATLEQCIVEVYKAVITYAAEMKYYLHHRLDRIGKALRGTSSESSFTEFKANIEEKRAASRNVVDDIRSEFSESQLKAIQDKISELVESHLSKITEYVADQQRETVLNWVSLATPATAHITQRDKAEAAQDALAEERRDPGCWIFDHPEYATWKSAEKTSSLWLVSGVGTGKTILTSTVIEDYLKRLVGPMAYFYYSSDSGNTATAEEILKSILRQFATSSEVGLRLVRSQWGELHQQRTLTRVEILQLIGSIIENEETLEATIIVDGLDEMNTDGLKTLLSSLHSLLGAQRGILKVFASSRWVQRIEDVFWNGFRIENIANHTEDDMSAYIDAAIKAEITDRRGIDDDLIEEVRVTLLGRANGMFRYIELALKYIFDGSTSKAIKKRLGTLPLPASGDAVLRPMYQKLFGAIEEEDPVSRLLAHRVIHWLLHQLYPLAAEQLLKAVCLGIDERNDDDVVSQLEDLQPGIDEVKAACHHLVVYNQKTRRFEFGHVSVIEYINWKVMPVFSDYCAQSTLAVACLAWLTRQYSAMKPEVAAGVDLSFGEYSILCWAKHWHRFGIEDSSSAFQAVFDQFWNKDAHLKAWIKDLGRGSFTSAVFDKTNTAAPEVWEGALIRGSRSMSFQSADSYHLAGLTRWECVLRDWAHLVPITLNQNTVSDQRWFLACSCDFPTAAVILVGSSSVKANSPTFVCGIKLALAFGSTGVLNAMLPKYIDTTQLHASGTSLLHHSVNLQSPQSTAACLDRFHDQINLRSSGAIHDEWVSTPLLMALRAARVGSLVSGQLMPAQFNLITSLLDAPNVDIRVSDKKGRNALILAIDLKPEPVIISRLLKGPADIFRRDNEGNTALVVGEKLDTRVDLRYLLDIVQGGMHPIQRAAKEGESDDVSHIISQLQQDPGVEDVRELLLSALFLAVENANMECMRLLLNHPQLDVNSQDQDGFTALMIAAINGKEYPITKLRLQGADVSLETSAGRNALFFAIQKKRLQALKALTLPMACSPSNVNHQDSISGRTALHYIFEHTTPTEMDWALPSRQDMFDVLIDRDADLDIKDKEDKTALDVAAENGYENSVELPAATTAVAVLEPKYEDKHGVLDNRADIDIADIGSWYSFESFKTLCYILATPEEKSEPPEY